MRPRHTQPCLVVGLLIALAPTMVVAQQGNEDPGELKTVDNMPLFKLHIDNSDGSKIVEVHTTIYLPDAGGPPDPTEGRFLDDGDEVKSWAIPANPRPYSKVELGSFSPGHDYTPLDEITTELVYPMSTAEPDRQAFAVPTIEELDFWGNFSWILGEQVDPDADDLLFRVKYGNPDASPDMSASQPIRTYAKDTDDNWVYIPEGTMSAYWESMGLASTLINLDKDTFLHDLGTTQGYILECHLKVDPAATDYAAAYEETTLEFNLRSPSE